MRITSYLQEESDFEFLKAFKAKEVILAPKVLSRKGTLKLEDLNQLSLKAKSSGYHVVLEWDVLINEQEFKSLVDLFSKIDLTNFDSIRVQDPGALEYIIEETELNIQWITEHGNHNLLGLQKWESYIGERLERLIVSNELSFEKLKSYEAELNTPLETLILGKILLFYTPRNLLSPIFENSQDQITALADSEESPHKGFFVVQNRHGSFMYHLKDRCLLNEIEKIQSFTKLWCRIDHHFIKDDKVSLMQKAVELIDDQSKWDEFKEVYPVGLTKGFFLTNKTDVLFPKLKNYRLLRADSSYVGEVVDVVRGQYIIFHQRSQKNLLSVGQMVHCATPEGKELEFDIRQMRDLEGKEIEQASHDQLVMIPFRKTVVSKSVINYV